MPIEKKVHVDRELIERLKVSKDEDSEEAKKHFSGTVTAAASIPTWL